MTYPIVLLLPVLLAASDPRPAPPPAPEISKPDHSWNGTKIAEYMERQHRMVLHEVDKLLREVRPAYPEPKQRRLAMLAVDETLHYQDPNANASPAVKSYYKARLDAAAYEIEKTRVREGAVIWKLYDHAFVVRTASVTVAFDLTRGFWATTTGQPEVDEPMKRIVEQCDALFISHNHGDHFDDAVRDQFLAEGKPIVAPADVFQSESRIIRPTRDGSTRQKVQLKNGRQLEVVVFPGFQGPTVDNVSLVFTPEEMSFAHTGDLAETAGNVPAPEDIWKWVDHVKDHWKVDVLMVNGWTTDPMRTIEGFGPKLVFTGHENEVGHDPLQRKPHCQAYEKLKDCKTPWITMEWGESYYYRP